MPDNNETYYTPPSSPRSLIPLEVSESFDEKVPDWGNPSPITPFVIAWLHVLLNDYTTKCRELQDEFKLAQQEEKAAIAQLNFGRQSHLFQMPYECLKACLKEIPPCMKPRKFWPRYHRNPTQQFKLTLNAPLGVHAEIANNLEIYLKVNFTFKCMMKKMGINMDVTDLVFMTVANLLKQIMIEKTSELKNQKHDRWFDVNQLIDKLERHNSDRQDYLQFLLEDLPRPQRHDDDRFMLKSGSTPESHAILSYRLFWNEYKRRMIDFP